MRTLVTRFCALLTGVHTTQHKPPIEVVFSCLNAPMKLKTLFTTPTATELAAKELAEAQRLLLSAQTAMEYARSQVTFNTERIERLKGIVLGAGK